MTYRTEEKPDNPKVAFTLETVVNLEAVKLFCLAAGSSNPAEGREVANLPELPLRCQPGEELSSAKLVVVGEVNSDGL